MRTLSHSGRTRDWGFTLIEMLIVIAIIGVLAALIIPVGGALKEGAKKKRTQAELAQIETAIERYKLRHGSNPPDNPGNPLINQLYFELIGTVLSNGVYVTLDGSARIRASDLPVAFGPKVTGFINCTRAGGGDDVQKAENFLPGLNPSQIWEIDQNGIPIKILVASVLWRDDATQPLGAAGKGRSPWRYNFSTPTNSSIDLWNDILVKNKTNRVSNWSKQPQVVP